MELTDKKFLTYEDFGAKADGVTDDVEAIVACHAFANEHKIPVKTNPNGKYYISGRKLTAEIATNVDFSTSEFIIDDREPEDYRAPIFRVPSTFPSFTPEIKELLRGQKKVDFPHEGNVFVRVYNNNEKIFIRYGGNADNGTATSDIFVIDKDGNIKTPIDWEYPVITSATAKCIDDAPLTIRGGVFTTIANQHDSFYHYHSRNFVVTRSNVTIEGITHKITGELDHGAPYGGFITASDCVNFTLKDALLTPHFIYWTQGQGCMVPMGTYDISLGATINVLLKNVTQTIDIMDGKYWGLMGSNFCKNIVLDGCEISRFDAHMGVTDGKILNSKLGHQCFNLIGHGDFLVENTELCGNSLVNLRGDYGAHFDGTLTIRNCVWTPRGKRLCIMNAGNNETHDFGYVSKMPETLVIDGLLVKDKAIEGEDVKLFALPNYNGNHTPDLPFQYVPTKKLILKNVRSEAGRVCEPSENPALYPDLVVEREG